MASQQRKQELLDELLDAYGLAKDDMGLERFLEEYALDGCVPGICTEPGCGYTTEYEPDQDAGWCENCGTNTVVSGLILADII